MRTSLSMIAHRAAGRRQHPDPRCKIEILDRLSLQNAACECYEQLR